MPQTFRFLVLLAVLWSSGLSAQTPVQGISTGKSKKKADLYNPPVLTGHVAYAYALINNRYETRGIFKGGFNAGLLWRTAPWFGIEGSFNRFKRHEAFSLGDIQSWNAEINGMFLMKLGETNLHFDLIFGAGYTDWKGYYIGPNLNDNYHYYIGKLLNDRFLTGNIGWGFSYGFLKQKMIAFGNFRLRFASDPKVVFGIIDAQYTFGIRYGLKSKDWSRSKKSNANRRTQTGGRPRVYKWVKDRN
jgi:hypothetical protein